MNKIRIICTHCEMEHIFEEHQIPAEAKAAICNNCGKRFFLEGQIYKDVLNCAKIPIFNEIIPKDKIYYSTDIVENDLSEVKDENIIEDRRKSIEKEYIVNNKIKNEIMAQEFDKSVEEIESIDKDSNNIEQIKNDINGITSNDTILTDFNEKVLKDKIICLTDIVENDSLEFENKNIIANGNKLLEKENIVNNQTKYRVENQKFNELVEEVERKDENSIREKIKNNDNSIILNDTISTITKVNNNFQKKIHHNVLAPFAKNMEYLSRINRFEQSDFTISLKKLAFDPFERDIDLLGSKLQNVLSEKIPTKFHNLRKTYKTRCIAVAMTKGGVGKTVTSINLATGLALENYNVLLVDTAVQGQIDKIFGIKKYGLAEFVAELDSFENCTTKIQNNLTVLGKGSDFSLLQQIIAKQVQNRGMVLANAFVEIKNKFDFVIFDTGSNWGSILVNVLFATEEILSPVQPNFLVWQNWIEFNENLQLIKKYNKNLFLKYIVPNLLTSFEDNEYLQKYIQNTNIDVLCNSIGYSKEISIAPSVGKSLFEYSPNNIEIANYKKLIKKIIEDEKIKFD